MSVDEVLSDKQPIIEELTARLRARRRGRGRQRHRPRPADRHRADQGGGGQLVAAVGEPAEAVPGRAGPLARLAELAAEEAISERETAAQQERETRRIDTERELAELRARPRRTRSTGTRPSGYAGAEQAEANDRALAELAHATALHALDLERERASRGDRDRPAAPGTRAPAAQLAQEGELALAAAAAQSRARPVAARTRTGPDAGARSTTSSREASLQAKLIDSLPEIVEKLPKPDRAAGGHDRRQRRHHARGSSPSWSM